MKLFVITIFALTLFGHTFADQGTCAAANHCMICADGGEACTGCFNWGSGTIGAKQYLVGSAPAACAVAVANKITDCKYYKGDVLGSAKSPNDCSVCNKDWFNVVDHATATSQTATCSDTAIGVTVCDAIPDNCDNGLCLASTAATPVYTKGCRLCKSGYMGSGTAMTVTTSSDKVGYPSCVTNTITNCDVGNGLDVTKCLYCASDFAVEMAETSCAAFTADSNCRITATAGTWCLECWMAYYFDAKVCVLKAGLIGFSMLALLALFNY